MIPSESKPTAKRKDFKRGFYLHTSWEYAYPFAVRSWQEEDFRRFFDLLKQLDFNLVMFWPLTEAMPAPLSEADTRELEAMRRLVDLAHACGHTFWLTFCPNTTSRPEIAEQPFRSRHLYPFRVEVRLDDPAAKATYLEHRAELIGILNNADAYVTIDGDPGGYPEAEPRQFAEVLEADRALLDRCGTRPGQQEVVPWIWQGWGSDWGKHGVWGELIDPLVKAQLKEIKTLPEPWTLLPGRHIRENRGNGRTVFALAEKAGLIERSVLLCYEIIEYEPTPPAVVLQFADIRRVLRQEAPLIAKARGVMGNAQQPILALPNLFFFARAAADPSWLDRSDEDVLNAFAEFLGGDATLLLPAWSCLQLDLEALPEDLADRLERTRLTSAAAQLVPGGPETYLRILAAFLRARIAVLHACAQPPNGPGAAVALLRATSALVGWWRVHRYVFTGEKGTRFQWEFTHPELLAPLQKWGPGVPHPRGAVIKASALELAARGYLAKDEASTLLNELCETPLPLES